MSGCLGRTGGSRPEDESDPVVGEGLGVVLRVVGYAVVAGAEESTVGEVGGPAVGPELVVVGVAEPGGGLAALGGATPVTHQQGDALGLGEESLAAMVNYLRRSFAPPTSVPEPEKFGLRLNPVSPSDSYLVAQLLAA